VQLQVLSNSPAAASTVVGAGPYDASSPSANTAASPCDGATAKVGDDEGNSYITCWQPCGCAEAWAQGAAAGAPPQSPAHGKQVCEQHILPPGLCSRLTQPPPPCDGAQPCMRSKQPLSITFWQPCACTNSRGVQGQVGLPPLSHTMRSECSTRITPCQSTCASTMVNSGHRVGSSMPAIHHMLAGM
jgi:hypothetical protein